MHSADSMTTVSAYYPLIDAGDIDGVLRLFADDAIYDRPGYPQFHGQSQLRAFYREVRTIESGLHTVENIVALGLSVAVEGTFQGTLKSGAQVSLRWADFWILNSSWQAIRRTTYFHTPLV